MIEVEGLTKYYGDHAAIRDLHFSIERGQVIGFLGLNGAGKSTTLKILGCVLLPTAGHVTIDGYDLSRDPHEIRKLIGFLPDVPPLYNEMTVRDYLIFVARLRGVAAGQARGRVVEVEKRVAVDEVSDQVIDTLSHGYRQRVGLAQAIVHNPKLLILDEPTSGLDPEQIVEMRSLIRSLRGEHTILLSSHNLHEVSETCDRLLVIDGGQIRADDTEENLARRTGDSGAIVIDVVGGEGVAERALSILRGVGGVQSARLDREEAGVAHLHVAGPSGLRPGLVRALVQSEVDILRVDASSDLETIFLKLTGTEKRNAA